MAKSFCSQLPLIAKRQLPRLEIAVSGAAFFSFSTYV